MFPAKWDLNMSQEERQLLAQRFTDALVDLTPPQRDELIAGIEINVAKEAIDAVEGKLSAKDKEEIEKIMDSEKVGAQYDDINKQWQMGSIGATEVKEAYSKIVSPESRVKLFDYFSENVKEFTLTYKELLIKKLEKLEEIKAKYIADSNRNLKNKI